MKPLIIIGAGLAGYTLAREFRKLDKASPMVVITADNGGFYSKPMLSNAFAQGKQAQQLVTQNATQMAEQLNASILAGTRVLAIDIAAQRVDTSAGSYDYGQLVIAVGAQPIRLTIAGDAAEHVMSVNHVDDYARFRERIARPQGVTPTRVAILGAGLIGCEFADDLAAGGHAVTLIDPNALPLAALAAPALSQGLRDALQKRGVKLKLGTTAARIDRSGDELTIMLADGSVFTSDVVLSAIGLRADLRLAQAAQLRTARGILVDVNGRTSAPNVYALGDCAEYAAPDGSTHFLPYIAPLMTAARAIARTLNGQPTAIDMKAAPVIVKTPSFPLALVPPPLHAAKSGSWRDTPGERLICRFFHEDGTMLGFGVAPHEAGVRNGLLAELGGKAAEAA
jgi:rubredoxin---NAD+ reductase